MKSYTAFCIRRLTQLADDLDQGAALSQWPEAARQARETVDALRGSCNHRRLARRFPEHHPVRDLLEYHLLGITPEVVH